MQKARKTRADILEVRYPYGDDAEEETWYDQRGKGVKRGGALTQHQERVSRQNSFESTAKQIYKSISRNALGNRVNKPVFDAWLGVSCQSLNEGGYPLATIRDIREYVRNMSLFDYPVGAHNDPLWPGGAPPPPGPAPAPAVDGGDNDDNGGEMPDGGDNDDNGNGGDDVPEMPAPRPRRQRRTEAERLRDRMSHLDVPRSERPPAASTRLDLTKLNHFERGSLAFDEAEKLIGDGYTNKEIMGILRKRGFSTQNITEGLAAACVAIADPSIGDDQTIDEILNAPTRRQRSGRGIFTMVPFEGLEALRREKKKIQ